jgi:hypothetical protein
MSETYDYLDDTRHLNASQKALFNAQSRSPFPVPCSPLATLGAGCSPVLPFPLKQLHLHLNLPRVLGQLVQQRLERL